MTTQFDKRWNLLAWPVRIGLNLDCSLVGAHLVRVVAVLLDDDWEDVRMKRGVTSRYVLKPYVFVGVSFAPCNKFYI